MHFVGNIRTCDNEKLDFVFSSSMAIVRHASCGHNCFPNYPASSPVLLSNQLYCMAIFGQEMLEKSTQDQVTL